MTAIAAASLIKNGNCVVTPVHSWSIEAPPVADWEVIGVTLVDSLEQSRHKSCVRGS